MTAVYGSQSTPRVLIVVSTLKAKHQTLFFLQWLLQRSTKKGNWPFYLRAIGENPSRITTVSSEKSKYVHAMYRPLTISTEIKLAAAFWAGFGRSKIILLAYCPKLNMLTRLFYFLLL